MSRAKDSNGMKPLDGQLDIVEELDTNQASELYELCKEVYKKTGWQPPSKSQRGSWRILYTSDYLLEKLPEGTTILKDIQGYKAWNIYNRKRISTYICDSPVEALLKLTIALSEAGELKMTNQASEDELGKTVHVDICAGASGECVYVNDYRVKGGKPWGGGTVTKSIEIKTDELLRAIEPEIQNIIRTEKLKLLAEMRERAEMVVGNVFDPSGEYVSVSEIDKLEAEL